MKARLIEESTLFASLIKWFFLAAIIGSIVGVSTSLFLAFLTWVTHYTFQMPHYYLLLPIGLCLSTFFIFKFAPDAEGHGTEQVIEAIHKKSGRINPLVVPVKLIATITTLSVGGSAGKEGPCAQIGAGIASLFCDVFRFKDVSRKKIVICGISAAFSSVFGTPIAGSLFAVEVLAIGRIQYSVLFPSFVAGIISFQISNMLGVKYFHSPIQLHESFSEIFFAQVLFIGLACGLCSYLFIEFLKFTETLSHHIKINKPTKAILGGLLVLMTVPISTHYLGLGLPMIEQSLNGGTFTAHWYDFLLKIYTTCVTLSFGGSGGIITPIFFVGSTFGSFLGGAMGLPTQLVAALGMVGLVSGCANTPISASILAMEMFGTEIGSYAAIVSIISFVLVGHRSVYPSQEIHLSKSDSIKLELGMTIEDLEKKPAS